MTTTSELIAFDLETTGVDTKADRIVELGIARVGAEPSSWIFNPEIPIPAEVTEIHGITDQNVADAPTFADRTTDVWEELGYGRTMLAGYNAIDFDAPMLNAEFERAGFEFQVQLDNILDAVVFVRWHLRHIQYRQLGPICRRYGVEIKRAHRAGDDAHATLRLIERLKAEEIIPFENAAALAAQARILPKLEAEFSVWSYWLYRHRETGVLCMGAGKYCGRPLNDVDPGYLRFMLGKVDDLPEAVRAEWKTRTL